MHTVMIVLAAQSDPTTPYFTVLFQSHLMDDFLPSPS